MKPLKVVIVDDEAAHLRLMKRAINKALPSAYVDSSRKPALALKASMRLALMLSSPIT